MVYFFDIVSKLYIHNIQDIKKGLRNVSFLFSSLFRLVELTRFVCVLQNSKMSQTLNSVMFDKGSGPHCGTLNDRLMHSIDAVNVSAMFHLHSSTPHKLL